MTDDERLYVFNNVSFPYSLIKLKDCEEVLMYDACLSELDEQSNNANNMGLQQSPESPDCPLVFEIETLPVSQTDDHDDGTLFITQEPVTSVRRRSLDDDECTPIKKKARPVQFNTLSSEAQEDEEEKHYFNFLTPDFF